MKILQFGQFHNFGPLQRLLAQRLPGLEDLGFQPLADFQVTPGRRAHPLLFIASAPVAELAHRPHLALEFAPPVLRLAPPLQLPPVSQTLRQIDAFALRVPEQIQVGREMNVGFQHKAIRFGEDGFSRTAFFFFENRPPPLNHNGVELLQHLIIRPRIYRSRLS